jgi:RNA polymerase sigma-70 factor (sigma-E family)
LIDDQAFERLIHARSPALMRAAWLLTGDWQRAEDLVQTSLSAAWTRRTKIRDPQALESYVRRVMINTFLSWRRRQGFHEIPVAEPTVDESRRNPIDVSTDTRLQTLSILRRLPRRQRAVIALRYLLDLSESDTAAALGCSVGTVRSHGARAIRAMRSDPQVAELIDGQYWSD